MEEEGTGLVKRVQVVGLILALLMSLGIYGVCAAAKVTDVSPSHWAYQAVVKLVDEGYLDLNSQGAFEGTKSVDRYTLAVVVAKILDNLSAGKATASEQDVALLHKLTTEFRDELVKWYQESDALTAKVDELATSNEVLKQQVYENADHLTAQDQAILQEIQGIRASLVQQSQAIAQLETVTSDHTRQLDAHSTAITNLEKILNVSVENRFQEREMALTMVKDDLAKADAELAAVQEALTKSVASLEQNQAITDENIAEIAERLVSIENSLLTSVSSQEEGLSQLKAELDAAKASFAALKENYEASQAANDVRLSDQEARLSDLEKSLNSYQARFDEMQSELGLLRQRLVTLEDTVVRIGKVVTVLDEELGQNLDANTAMALQRYRVLEQNVAQLQEELKLQKAASQEQIAQMKKTNSFLMLGGGVALLLLLVLGQ